MAAERPLGMVHVASVVIGAIIGVGIFFTPSAIAQALPTPGWILGVWVLGGVASVASAVVYAELGGRFPHAGGIYVFLREGFGPKVGPFLAFQYGWVQLLVIQPGAMAAIALVLVDNIAFLTGEFSPVVRSLLAIFAILVFTGANLLGVKTGGRIQVGVAAMKITALVVMVAIGIGWGNMAGLTTPTPTPPSGTTFSFLLAGLIPVLWSFGGAYHGTFIAGSVKDPERSVPRGIVAGIAVVLLLYMTVNVAYLSLLGHEGLAAAKSPAAEATGKALGSFAGKALAVTIILSASGILNTVCLGFPFVLYAMARDGLFFSRAAKLDERTGRPALAVALQGLVACVAVIASQSKIAVLLIGMAFADALFQGFVAVVHGRMRSVPRPAGVLKAPLVATIVVIVIEVGLAIGCVVDQFKASAVAMGSLVVGVGAWFLFRRGRPAPA